MRASRSAGLLGLRGCCGAYRVYGGLMSPYETFQKDSMGYLVSPACKKDSRLL